MVIVRESAEVARQAGFTEYDHMIQAFPPNRADHSLDIGSLPGRPGRREHLFDAHHLHLLHEVRPEDPIAIAQQIAWRGLPGKGLAQLLSRPLAVGCAVTPKCRMRRGSCASTRNTYRIWN